MFAFLTQPDSWASLATLSAMEVVLGIDNIIFIAILCGGLPQEQREKARKIGLFGAFATRLLLLSVISFIAQLTEPLFSVNGFAFSGKALILLAGGLFLLYKATKEIHHKLEGADDGDGATTKRKTTFKGVIIQIMLLDLVFSIDSVITAVGMTPHVSIMVVANVIALAVMLAAGGVVGAFVERHPSVKILALSFLLMIGTMLIAEGLSFHIPKGYIYFSMAFSVIVEALNIRSSTRSKPVQLRATPKVADMEKSASLPMG